MIFPIDFSFVSKVSVVRNTSNLDLASLNRGFPNFRSSTFRKILTLRGSCKTSFSNLRVFESLYGLDRLYGLTFSSGQFTEKLTCVLRRHIPFPLVPGVSRLSKVFQSLVWLTVSYPIAHSKKWLEFERNVRTMRSSSRYNFSPVPAVILTWSLLRCQEVSFQSLRWSRRMNNIITRYWKLSLRLSPIM